jgi:alpha-ketoglutarate-dependent taurine dioxygenase
MLVLSSVEVARGQALHVAEVVRLTLKKALRYRPESLHPVIVTHPCGRKLHEKNH